MDYYKRWWCRRIVEMQLTPEVLFSHVSKVCLWSQVKWFNELGREMSSERWSGLAFPWICSVQCFSKYVPTRPKWSLRGHLSRWGEASNWGPTLFTLASADVASRLPVLHNGALSEICFQKKVKYHSGAQKQKYNWKYFRGGENWNRYGQKLRKPVRNGEAHLD